MEVRGFKSIPVSEPVLDCLFVCLFVCLKSDHNFIVNLQYAMSGRFCLYLVSCLYPLKIQARCPGHTPQPDLDVRLEQ